MARQLGETNYKWKDLYFRRESAMDSRLRKDPPLPIPTQVIPVIARVSSVAQYERLFMASWRQVTLNDALKPFVRDKIHFLKDMFAVIKVGFFRSSFSFLFRF